MFSDIAALKHQVQIIKRQAKNNKKKFQVFALCHIVCKKTDNEAIKYYDEYSKKNADKIAIQNFSNIIAKNPKNKILKSIQKRICKRWQAALWLPNHWISKKSN